MIKPLAAAFFTLFAAFSAQSQNLDVDSVIDRHILPGFTELAEATRTLNETATEHCTGDNPKLRTAYAAAFSAWIRVSHLRFGPTETDDRAFALAFWPDSRGATPKTLAGLIRDRDPVIADPDTFSTVSIAARGFYALEFLLYDPAFKGADRSDYRCALLQAITTDIQRIAGALLADWRDSYGNVLRLKTPSDVYRTPADITQTLFKALSSGLQFTSDTRLGRPLGTFERPRPTRAEAWRSGQSLTHVVDSLTGTRDLAMILSDDDATLDAAYRQAFEIAADLNDPVFAGVGDPAGRLRVEILQQSIDAIRLIVASELGPRLGVAAGFNALDGD